MNNPEFILLAFFTVLFIIAVLADAMKKSPTAKENELEIEKNPT